MSLAVKPIQTYVCIDPRINQHENNEYLIQKGGSYYGWQQVNANNVSQNSATWTFNSPSVKTFIDRCIYVKHRIAFNIKGVNSTPGTNLVNLGVSDSLQFSPLSHRLWETVTATFNSSSISYNCTDIQPALARTMYGEKIRRFNKSISPCSIMDNHQNYEDIADPANPYFSMYSLNNNPCGQYGQGREDGRGSFAFVSRTKVSDNNDIIVYDITEPLPISPFIDTDYHYQSAFIGLISLSVNISFNSAAIYGGAMWSHNDLLGNVLTSIEAEVQSGQLLLNVINPPDTMVLTRGIVTYPYNRFDRYISPIGTILKGETYPGFTSNTVTLPMYPSRFYIYARRPSNTWDWSTTETYALLSNLNITLKSKNGLIASANVQQLYEVCIENGLRLSFSQFTRDVGSVLVIDLNLLAMDDDSSPGVAEQIQIQVKVDVTNLNLKKDLVFQLIVTACNPGIFAIDQSNQTCTTQVGIVSKNDVINSSMSPIVDYHLLREIYGGDLTGKLASFGNKFSSFATKAKPYISKAYQLAKEYGPDIAKGVVKYAPLVLAGLGEEEGEQYLQDGGRLRRKRKAPSRRR